MPEWVTFVSSGAIFIVLFGGMVKWIMNGIKESLNEVKTELKGLANQVQSIRLEAVRQEHLPNQIESLTDRVRDVEKESKAAFRVLDKHGLTEKRVSQEV